MWSIEEAVVAGAGNAVADRLEKASRRYVLSASRFFQNNRHALQEPSNPRCFGLF